MSYHLFSKTWQPARKPHACIWCGDRIRLLEVYLREKSIYDGHHQNHAWHWDCWFFAQVEYFNQGEEEFSARSNERPPMRPFRCMEAA